MNKILVLVLVNILSVTNFATSLKLGAHYHKGHNHTEFQVYATNATKVELLIFNSKNSEEYQVHNLQKFSGHNLNSLDQEVAKDTWSKKLNGSQLGKYYKYRTFGNNSISYKVNSANRVSVNHSNVEIFLFHKKMGYMIDTSSHGYMDPFATKVRKDVENNRSTFTLNDSKDSFDNYSFEIVKSGSYPSRLNGYLSSDPYCYDLDDESNRCQVVEFGEEFHFKENEKRLGFQDGHSIHEVHVKSLTKRLKGIPSDIQGTYKAISHPLTLRTLRDMGVSTIEFLPIHHFDYTAAPPNHINYWGYMTKSFFAIHPRYATSADTERQEFKEAIAALHRVGISVVLDVVYNHTSEGDHRGPNLSFKNLARDKYFRMHNQDKGYFLNTTGVGNTFASENAVSRKMILDSLKFFVETYQIDGFRFDLGAAIDKKTFEKIREVLPKNTLLTAEPWVAEGAPQWHRGELNYLNIGAWNDKYRQAL
ncbi:alpha-amylase family glycosyl hydrolase [bacterium]|nr:alpha-amylase family glycosyl hydrolase [bacterium]